MYITETLDSVWRQDYGNIEVIVVDDGSSDSQTVEILNQIADPKVRKFRIQNSGPSVARNIGINKAKGKYILPLDADDLIHPAYIREAVKVLENDPSISVVYAQAEYFGNRQGPWNLPPFNFPAILFDNMVYCSAVFRKADFLKVGGYNKNMDFGWEDWDLWLSFIENGFSFFYQLPNVRFYYRIKSVSRTTQFDQNKRISMYMELMRNHQDLFMKNLPVLVTHYIRLKDDLVRLRDYYDKLQANWLFRILKKTRNLLKSFAKLDRIFRRNTNKRKLL